MRTLNTTRYRTADGSHKHRSDWSLYTSYNGDPPSKVDFTASLGTGTHLEKEMWDNLTDGWIAKKESGEIVMNDMMSEQTVFVYDTLFHASGNRDYGWYWKQVVAEVATYQAYAGLLFPSLSLTTDTKFDAESDLITSRLYGQIQSAQMDALTAIAELDKSVASLNRLFRGAIHMFKNVKKIRSLFHHGMITAAQAADAYLECRYGLRPIYYDVLATIEALNAYGKPRRKKVEVNRVVDDTTGTPYSYGHRVGTTSTGVYPYYNVVDSEKNMLSAGAVLEFKAADADFFSEFDLDLVQTAWELIPFSFIADWFLNIGDLLNSWTPVYDCEILGTYLTLREEKRRSAYGYKMYSYHLGQYLNDVSHNGTTIKVVRTRRYANPSRPWLPRLNIRLDGLKLLDLLAIFGGYTTDFRRWKI